MNLYNYVTKSVIRGTGKISGPHEYDIKDIKTKYC